MMPADFSGGRGGVEMRLYVGNLPYQATDEDLREAFGAHGDVVGATVVRDRDTGRSRGFGFVEFGDDETGRRAMAAMDGVEMAGRALRVSEAHERPQGGGGGFRGAGRGG
jgi:RNA recognition motif-containing protein